MDFSSITSQSKLDIVTNLIIATEMDLYREMLGAGLEPEEVTSLDDVDTTNKPELEMRLIRIREVATRLDNLKQKLAALG